MIEDGPRESRLPEGLDRRYLGLKYLRIVRESLPRESRLALALGDTNEIVVLMGKVNADVVRRSSSI
jgi:hypothetical protein